MIRVVHWMAAAMAAVAAACSGAPGPGATPAATVEAIYAPYIANAEPPANLSDRAPWSDELRDLIEAHEQAVAAGEAEALDFGPIVDGQDWDFTEVAVAARDGGTETASVVDATFTNFEQPVTVTYDLVRAADGWRVDDISTEAWTLRGLLAEAGVSAHAAPEAAE